MTQRTTGVELVGVGFQTVKKESREKPVIWIGISRPTSGWLRLRDGGKTVAGMSTNE
jgi:hypothetical protein